MLPVSQATSTRYPPGTLLGGRYEVIRPLGWGGMAEVYLTSDRLLGRQVAVKVILERYAGDEQFASRFRREARAAASLNHPNVVAVHDVGTHDGNPFIVMEHVPGRTLAEVVHDGGPMPADRAAEIGEAAARALGAAHAAGIVHRDVKPGNVMVTADGRIKVLDFGIARALRWTPLTDTPAVQGTVEYMAPEYVRGEGADGRSDLYSLGAVLYELLTGRPPFTGDSPLQVAYRHLEEAPVPPDAVRADIPPALAAVVLRCLAKHPGDRYRRAEELAADLAAAASGRPAATAPLRRRRTQILREGPQTAGPERRSGHRLRWAVGASAVALVLVTAVVTVAALQPDTDRGRRGGPRRVRPVAELSAEGACSGWLAAEVTLTWSPTASRFADGYDVYRATESGGQYDLVAFVPGRDSAEYVDGQVGLGETYFYLVTATAGQRESRPTQAQADTPSVCLF
jgi:tRNA A-37 threonylcarbamoyl transferase component Bud32